MLSSPNGKRTGAQHAAPDGLPRRRRPAAMMRILGAALIIIALLGLAARLNQHPHIQRVIVRMPAPNVPEPGPFHGYGNVTIGNLEIPAGTTLVWSCPDCSPRGRWQAFGGLNFIVTNGANDPASIQVDALGVASGRTVLDAGVYTSVEVITGAASWSLRFVR